MTGKVLEHGIDLSLAFSPKDPFDIYDPDLDC